MCLSFIEIATSALQWTGCLGYLKFSVNFIEKKMKLLNLQVLIAMMLVAPIAGAQSRLMSEDEALKNFKEAAKLYRQLEENTEEPAVTEDAWTDTQRDVEDDLLKSESLEDDMELAADEVEQMEDELDDEMSPASIGQPEIDAYNYVAEAEYAPIEDIVVAVNLENQTLQQVVRHIIEEARDEAGEWDVKWRISAENNYILNERVNLIAETNLSEFMSYLVDRVNNMTGIQLFVTVFDKSRIIVISDTYY